MKKQKEKCEFMILTPHFDSGHNGGMWCNENYPCEQHGKWKDFNLERVNSTPKPSVKESWTERFDKKFVKSELTFNGVVVKRSCLCLGHCECNLFMTAEPKEIKAFITSELETARKEERLRSAKIVEELMEDSEHWQPIASRIMDRVIIIKEDLY